MSTTLQFWIPFLGCLWPAIMLLIVIACIREIVIAVLPPRRPAHPCCARCGYAVAGLAEPRCPECGADLRIAGIDTPALAMRYRGSTWRAVCAWTVLLAIIGGFAVVLAISIPAPGQNTRPASDLETTLAAVAMVFFILLWITGVLTIIFRRASLLRRFAVA